MRNKKLAPLTSGGAVSVLAGFTNKFTGRTKLRSRRITFARNRLDLTDRVQVRVVKRRLKVSDEQFANLVQKAGNSIAGLRKEATCQRLLTLPKVQMPPAQVPPADAIAPVEELGS